MKGCGEGTRSVNGKNKKKERGEGNERKRRTGNKEWGKERGESGKEMMGEMTRSEMEE